VKLPVPLDQKVLLDPSASTVGRSKYIFASPKMRMVYDRARQVARADTTVLIMGESGSGKEVVARLIHELSPRRTKPFIAVNCSSFPGSLMEVELFGYERGAFTGAYQRHRGLFEQSHGGTLLLDEIAELDLSLQAKFLRVLQEKSFRRVGGESEVGVDVRLLASTHRSLKKYVDAGRFREDLFYRISVFPIEVPPVRERPEDLVALTQYFIDHFNREMGRRVAGITEDTKKILLAYAWPGNVRELRNTIERMIILREDGLICPEELPIEIITGVQRLPAGNSARSGADPATPDQVHDMSPTPVSSQNTPQSIMGDTGRSDGHNPIGGGYMNAHDLADLDGQLAQLEKTKIAAALGKAGGNQSEAARLLGIRRDTLRFRMKKYSLL